MDSKNIYISSQTYLKNVAWIKNNSDTEWIYISNDTLKIDLLIDNFFERESEFYLITDRHCSKQADKEQILKNTKDYLENYDFLIWNLRFNKVIEFNDIGVYRIGTHAT